MRSSVATNATAARGRARGVRDLGPRRPCGGASTPVAKVSRHAESRDAMLAPGWRPDHPHARSGADARRVGATFRTRGISLGRVLSSPWCRCLETARLAFGGAEVWPALGNLFDNRAREAEQLPGA